MHRDPVKRIIKGINGHSRECTTVEEKARYLYEQNLIEDNDMPPADTCSGQLIQARPGYKSLVLSDTGYENGNPEVDRLGMAFHC